MFGYLRFRVLRLLHFIRFDLPPENAGFRCPNGRFDGCDCAGVRLNGVCADPNDP